MIEHGIENVGTLLPHDRPVTKGGSMATPTAAQRKMFAKMGIAMSDGSYYIRTAAELSDAIKAVGRGNADHDDIRKHIITRAHALHLDKQIPSDWNPDGSEKTTVAHGQEFLEHFGVKGMHWGQRKSKADLIASAKNHEAISAAHSAAAAHVLKEHEDLNTRGVHSDAFQRVYGNDAPTVGDTRFYYRTGQSKAQALQSTDSNLRLLHNQYANSANRHSKKAAKLRAKASTMTHSLMTPEEVVAHFGRKGMHWGEHVFGGNRFGPDANASADHNRAQAVRGTIKTGGVKAASNKDLQDLVTRLNLEQQHARLTATPSRVEAGHTFIKKSLGITKTGLDVVQTGARVASTVNDVRDATARHQRNKPLKVVSIGR
jgi:hypothetical protein